MSTIDSLDDLKSLEEFVGSYSALIDQTTETFQTSFDPRKPQNALLHLADLKRTRLELNRQAEEEAKLIREKTVTIQMQKNKCQESIKELREKLKKLKTERENLLREKEKNNVKLKFTNESINNIENESDMDTREVEKELNLFRNTLGLDLKKPRENLLTITFRYIFQTNPDRLCSFGLMIQNNVYSVKDFSPDIGDVSVLVDFLNKNNNLGHFIVEIRNRFKLFENK